MAADDKRRDSRTGQTDKIRAKSPPEPPFDAWLRKQLHEMYDQVAREPLPNAILDLIDKDAARTGKSPEDGTKTPPDKK